MKQAYLVLASERRVLNVVLDDDPDAIQRAIGYQTIEHGTPFQTEDQLFIGGDELGGVPQDRFWAAGVPFAFHGNALLVGIDPLTGDTASRPQMTIEEFQRLITFDIGSHGWRLPILFPERYKKPTCKEAARAMRASKRSRNRQGVKRAAPKVDNAILIVVVI